MPDPSAPKDPPIRDAATIVLLRQTEDGPHVLMGQRGAGAVFMPSKYVFPGGRMDPGDLAVRLAPDLRPEVRARLESRAAPIGRGLAAAAIRELWEETGLRLGAPGRESFLGQGLSPNAEPLDFFFRAITPPGRPRRFGARFFLCDAGALAGDPDDFSAAGDELSHLHWLPLGRARELDMPFITQVVLSELQARLIEPDPSRPVPFFDHTESYSRYHAL